MALAQAQVSHLRIREDDWRRIQEGGTAWPEQEARPGVLGVFTPDPAGTYPLAVSEAGVFMVDGTLRQTDDTSEVWGTFTIVERVGKASRAAGALMRGQVLSAYGELFDKGPIYSAQFTPNLLAGTPRS